MKLIMLQASAPSKFPAIYPPLNWDEAGGIRIGSTRVTLDSLLAAYHNGLTPEEIAIQYSVLSIEDIYSTIAYYLNYRQEIDCYLAQRQQKAQQFRQGLTEKYNLGNLRERLLTRREQSSLNQNAPCS